MAATKTKKPTKALPKKLKARSNRRLLNKWIIFAGVATVAITGALIVRLSGASSCDKGSYTFKRCLSQFTYKVKTFDYGTKTYASTWQAPVDDSSISAESVASLAEMKKSTQVCTHVYNNTNRTQIFTLHQLQRVGSSGAETYLGNAVSRWVAKKSTDYFCAKKATDGNIIIEVSSQATGPYQAGVDTIYGK